MAAAVEPFAKWTRSLYEALRDRDRDRGRVPEEVIEAAHRLALDLERASSLEYDPFEKDEWADVAYEEFLIELVQWMRRSDKATNRNDVGSAAAVIRTVTAAGYGFGCLRDRDSRFTITAVLSLYEDRPFEAIRALEGWGTAVPAGFRGDSELTRPGRMALAMIKLLLRDSSLAERCERLLQSMNSSTLRLEKELDEALQPEEPGSVDEVLEEILEQIDRDWHPDLWDEGNLDADVRDRPDLLFRRVFKKLEKALRSAIGGAPNRAELRNIIGDIDGAASPPSGEDLLQLYFLKLRLLRAVATAALGTSGPNPFEKARQDVKKTEQELDPDDSGRRPRILHRSFATLLEDAASLHDSVSDPTLLWAMLAAVWEIDIEREGLARALHAASVPHQRRSVAGFIPVPGSEALEFKVLRRWSSMTPLSQAGKHTYENVGGCYALKSGEKWLLLDPGFDSLYTLWAYSDLAIEDLEAVIVSHGHPDHDASLGDALCTCVLAEERTTTLNLATPDDQWFDFPTTDVQALDKKNRLKTAKIALPHLQTSFQVSTGAGNMAIVTRPTSHRARAYDNKSDFIGRAFSFEVAGNVIGITSDASGLLDPPSLASFFSTARVLVVHVGGFAIEEASPKPKPANEQHLGLLGATQLIRHLWNRPDRNLELVVLSEFAAVTGLLDWRVCFWRLLLQKLSACGCQDAPVMIGELGSSVLVVPDGLYVATNPADSGSGFVPVETVDWRSQYRVPLASTVPGLNLKVEPGWRNARHPLWL